MSREMSVLLKGRQRKLVVRGQRVAVLMMLMMRVGLGVLLMLLRSLVLTLLK
jgi:hypothetical protein